MDLTTLTDEQLDDHRRAVLIEKERRIKLAQLPDQLADMARDAAEAGCDPEELRARVDEALTPEQTTSPDGSAADHFDYLEN